MVHSAYNPTVRLLCQKCRKQTAHLMIGFSNDPLSVLTLTFECQECGEIKKAFDLNTLPELKVPAINENEWREPIEVAVGQQSQPQQQGAPIEKGPQIDR